MRTRCRETHLDKVEAKNPAFATQGLYSESYKTHLRGKERAGMTGKKVLRGIKLRIHAIDLDYTFTLSLLVKKLRNAHNYTVQASKAT